MHKVILPSGRTITFDNNDEKDNSSIQLMEAPGLAERCGVGR